MFVHVKDVRRAINSSQLVDYLSTKVAVLRYDMLGMCTTLIVARLYVYIASVYANEVLSTQGFARYFTRATRRDFTKLVLMSLHSSTPKILMLRQNALDKPVSA